MKVVVALEMTVWAVDGLMTPLGPAAGVTIDAVVAETFSTATGVTGSLLEMFRQPGDASLGDVGVNVTDRTVLVPAETVNGTVAGDHVYAGLVPVQVAIEFTTRSSAPLF